MEENPNQPRTSFSTKKRKLLQTNRILSLSALFVSASTLFILVYQTYLSNEMYYLQEKAQKMSVFPYLELGTSFDQGIRHQIALQNNGLGPALIKSRHILYQDSVYDMDLASFILAIINPDLPDQDILSINYSNLGIGQLVPTNKSIVLIGNNDKKTAEQMYDLFNLERHISIAITYTSIYEDQTWTCYYGTRFPIPKEPEGGDEK